MIVNDKKLKELARIVTADCKQCPLLSNEDLCPALDFDQPDDAICVYHCEDQVLYWLKEFDVQSALEAGAHIVNDAAVFPSESIEISFGGETNEEHTFQR